VIARSGTLALGSIGWTELLLLIGVVVVTCLAPLALALLIVILVRRNRKVKDA
jgi:hypothetical protein